MSQNIVVTILTILFYLTSLLGGGTNTPATPQQPRGLEEQRSSIAGQRGSIQGDRVTVRSGPGTEHDAITSLGEGSQVTLLQASDGWYNVRLPDGRTGWIAGYLVNIDASNQPARPNHGKTVIGYYMLGAPSYNSLLANSEHLTAIAPWSWGIDSQGRMTADFEFAKLAEALEFAGNRGLETYALIHNYHNNAFDSRAVSALLNNPTAVERAVNQIHSTLKDWGMSGINLDFENVPAQDRQALTDFVAALSARLHTDGLKMTMAVPAKTGDNPTNAFSGAYDYAALANYVDNLVIMGYDQHYRRGDPGPIASYEWVTNVIQYATSQVPSNTIILGVAGYGYDWPQTGHANALTYSQAMELAAAEGVSIRWHSTHKVPFFHYGNGRQVWFENRYSLRYKLSIVNEFDLGGIALWRLGQEDPGIWQTIDERL